MVDLAGPLLDSLLLGSLYTIMALGLTITYKVTRIPNFSHAELVTVGSYAGVVAVNVWGRGLAEALLLAIVASAGIALAADELVFKPLFRRAATSLHLLVASIGVGLVIRYVLSILANAAGILSAKSHLLATTLISVGPGANLTTLHLWIPAATASAVIALHLLFTRTRIGKGMRAMASNFDLARVFGIPTARVRRITWILAGGLAGVRALASSLSADEGLAGALVVGRFKDGTPVTVQSSDGLGAANNFEYLRADRVGNRCPFHAHIQKANQRVRTRC